MDRQWTHGFPISIIWYCATRLAGDNPMATLKGKSLAAQPPRRSDMNVPPGVVEDTAAILTFICEIRQLRFMQVLLRNAFRLLDTPAPRTS